MNTSCSIMAKYKHNRFGGGSTSKQTCGVPNIEWNVSVNVIRVPYERANRALIQVRSGGKLV